MKLCVGTYFTKGWCYSVDSWLENFCASISGIHGELVVSTDYSEECDDKFRLIQARTKFHGWNCHNVKIKIPDDSQKPYKNEAQLIIARLQQKAFSMARTLEADYFWSIESDVLVPPNSAKVLIQSLEFDDSYYGVSMITYPNGLFLGGRGTQYRQIEEDFKIEDRNVPKDIMAKIKKLEATIKKPSKGKKPNLDACHKELGELVEKAKTYPPKGNIFHLQAKGWKKRGWLECAYPAVGRGAILPTDWVGLGCTMMNKKALSLASFEGYELGGTQDLFLCWHRWNPAGIKMCVIPHVLCSHVKRKIDENGDRSNELEMHEAYHEMDGECQGHLRQRKRKYINFNE